MAKKPNTCRTGREKAARPLHKTAHPQGGMLPAEFLAGGAPQKPVGNVHQAAFLAAFKATGNISAAAKAAGIGRRTHYWWLDNDAGYAQAFEDAKVEALDAVELECRRRGVDGIPEYVLYRGKVVEYPKGTPLIRKRYSDAILIRLLRALAPEKYGLHHRPDIPHRGLPEGNADLAEARLDKIEEHLRQENERRREHEYRDVSEPVD